MANTGMGTTPFGPSAVSRAAHLAAAIDKLVVAKGIIARKQVNGPKAEHWRAGPLPQQSPKQTDKTDSKYEPEPPLVPARYMSRTQEMSILSALPQTIITEIYATEAWQRHEPIDFTYYFGSVDFVFDVRTKDGLSAFRDWTDTLAWQAWSVRSLTIKHWTAWWGFDDNKWLSAGDQTQFLRGSSGELKISRALGTLPEETCKCSMAQMLTQLDPSFDLEQYKEITTMRQFAHQIRAPAHQAKRPTLVDAASLYVKLLQEHSKHMGKYYGRSGSQCVDCKMPSVYLCGHLSTKIGRTGLGMSFDPSAALKVAPKPKPVPTLQPITPLNYNESRVVDWLNGVESPGFRRKQIPGAGALERQESVGSVYSQHE